MKNQSGLRSSPILEFAHLTPENRFLPCEVVDKADVPTAASGEQPGNWEKPVHASFSAPRLHLKSTLPTNDFHAQLFREKRLAERTKRPLSIALYRIDEQAIANDQATGADQLLEVLHQASRETDIIGHVSHDLIAVLCPDTDAAGMRAYVSKVEKITAGCWTVVDIATYPDRLFDGLETLSQLKPELHHLVVGDPGTHHGGYRSKRALDILGAALALVLLAPLMGLVALAIATTSPGPVLFKQIRLGRGGAKFLCYKFRSMVVDGDDEIHRKFVASLIKGGQDDKNVGHDGTPVFKMRSDPRVTWIGRVIRKTSIDELPQLFNVLKGEMSLVGPRPPIPYEAENYQAWHLRRILSATPGITGLWQVEGRSKVTFSEMVRLDLRYIRECSLGLDVKILMKTIKVVLQCDGAV
ncbi:sugar transferase [Azohydromonas australica]|uniref:sugar transferase n=1 Tax=Azohydromonas australica TaxID=364039 RepID=UPI001EE446F0|nr:sugar transferase [Azohydromonas australica]